MVNRFDYAFKYSMRELKRLFPNTPFLEVKMQELEGDEVKVKSLEEFIDVCDKLRLLVEYSIDEENGSVRFLTKYQGRTLVYETGIDELYKAVNRIRELKESVV
ncbi:MAG: hypothetical protein H0Z18_04045 [Thermococcus sp.]|uniref:hypothetical protein n=1 Tax=Thermococcus sp. TaxID=35749 RepID=UPI001DB37316|nr:hypothetical protein [Thermococcus sp.]MBO8174410.1 hypothetical protein [Thermococcus sp.]